MDKQTLIKAIRDSSIEIDSDILGISGMYISTQEAVELIEKQATIRPEIMQFAQTMEAEMARHDAEKGDSWKSEDIDFEWRIFEHYSHLQNVDYPEEAQDVAIDIANYAMMIWHKAKGE